MSETPIPFNRKAFREEIRQQLEGLPRQSQVWFASRCAWRASPALFANSANQEWIEKHGEGLQAALLVSLLLGSDYKSAAYAAYAASAAYAADYASAASAAAYAASYAADYAAYASASASASAAYAAYDAASYTSLTKVHPAWEFLASSGPEPFIAACRWDLRWLVSQPPSSETMASPPLWPEESTPKDWMRQWWDAVAATMGSRQDARQLYHWLQGMAAGQPPLEEMNHWLEQWWAKHPKNKKRTGSSTEEPTHEESSSSEPLPEPEVEELKPTTSILHDTEAPELTQTARECATALHTFLASPDTQPPLTVSVEAPWGGGKSSVLRYLQKRLEGTAKDLPQTEPHANSIPTVWFNPWKHEAGKTLWAAFAVAFERQLRDKNKPRWQSPGDPWWYPDHCLQMLGFWLSLILRPMWLSWLRLSGVERCILGLRLSLWGLAAWGLSWLISHGFHEVSTTEATETNGQKNTLLIQQLLLGVPWLGAAVWAWGFLNDMMKQFGSPLKLDVVRLFSNSHHKDGVDDLHRFQEDFRRLLRTYIPQRNDGQARRLVVFIDDLDRCEAPKAADVLQSLFQMLYLAEDRHDQDDDKAENSTEQKVLKKRRQTPGVICILGMDREKVAAAIAAKHEKLLPLLLEPQEDRKKARQQALDFGHTFLEKFIQLTLHLPAMQGSDRETYLKEITGWKDKPSAPLMSSRTIPAPGTASRTPQETTTTPEPESPATPVTQAPITEPTRRAEQAAAQKRVQEADKEIREGPIVFLCANYVADSLENNPRKLKQFINLFRLRLFLAAAMDDLDKNTLRENHPSVADGKLSAHHIAKLVALEIACPRRMNDLRAKLLDHKNVREAVTNCPAENEPALKALLSHRSDEAGYDLTKAPIHLYFHQESV